MTASSPCGTFSQAELTEVKVLPAVSPGRIPVPGATIRAMPGDPGQLPVPLSAPRWARAQRLCPWHRRATFRRRRRRAAAAGNHAAQKTSRPAGKPGSGVNRPGSGPPMSI